MMATEVKSPLSEKQGLIE